MSIEINIRAGDTYQLTEQTDGSYSVTFRLLDAEGKEQTYIANVPSPQAYYDTVRDMTDNPYIPPVEDNN